MDCFVMRVMWVWRGSRTILSFLLLLGITFGCAVPGVYLPVPPPVLTAAPVSIPCNLNRVQSMCVIVTKDDWRDVVLVLKAYCLALGGSDEVCQVHEDR